MINVALDLFNMPQCKHKGEMHEMMAVCVDRQSGFMVAITIKNKGLTGAKIAKKMIQYQWRPFVIPSLITSDLESHLTGE